MAALLSGLLPPIVLLKNKCMPRRAKTSNRRSPVPHANKTKRGATGTTERLHSLHSCGFRSSGVIGASARAQLLRMFPYNGGSTPAQHVCLRMDTHPLPYRSIQTGAATYGYRWIHTSSLTSAHCLQHHRFSQARPHYSAPASCRNLQVKTNVCWIRHTWQNGPTGRHSPPASRAAESMVHHQECCWRKSFRSAV